MLRISDDCIFCGRAKDGIINIYPNDGVYSLIGSVDLRPYFLRQGKKDAFINDVTLINSNLMMAVCWSGIALFRSHPERFSLV